VAEDLPLVVIADPIDADAIRALKEGPCRVVDATSGTDALEAQLPKAWGLVVRSRTKVTEALMAQAPRLKIVGRAGVGVDNVDLAAANRRKIQVVNAPSAATASVAELAIAFYLLLSRELYPQIEATKDGTWKRGQNRAELEGSTIGFVGYGRIAREIARRLVPFGVHAIAYDPFVTSTTDGTSLVALETLLKESNFVSVHAALTPENHHLLNAERIATMRPGAFIVNVARGPLLDEEALLAALDEGRLGGAALDVFESEPPTRPRLLAHPRVIATPHIGASTHEAQARAGADVVAELLRALRGEPLQACVNPGAGG
jgi:D-3-phosphoglycerate dehydrogenase